MTQNDDGDYRGDIDGWQDNIMTQNDGNNDSKDVDSILRGNDMVEENDENNGDDENDDSDGCDDDDADDDGDGKQRSIGVSNGSQLIGSVNNDNKDDDARKGRYGTGNYLVMGVNNYQVFCL